ncbi:MAG: hypothetical protein ABI813_15680 [Bacteroidota bacterium]
MLIIIRYTFFGGNGNTRLRNKIYLFSCWASRYDSYKWQTISISYENGSFVFKKNSPVIYDNTLGSLYVRWEIFPPTSGYYDAEGGNRESYHLAFSLQLFDAGNNYTGNDWYFDDK